MNRIVAEAGGAQLELLNTFLSHRWQLKVRFRNESSTPGGVFKALP